jgi:hypothetical protein
MGRGLRNQLNWYRVVLFAGFDISSCERLGSVTEELVK